MRADVLKSKDNKIFVEFIFRPKTELFENMEDIHRKIEFKSEAEAREFARNIVLKIKSEYYRKVDEYESETAELKKKIEEIYTKKMEEFKKKLADILSEIEEKK